MHLFSTVFPAGQQRTPIVCQCMYCDSSKAPAVIKHQLQTCVSQFQSISSAAIDRGLIPSLPCIVASTTAAMRSRTLSSSHLNISEFLSTHSPGASEGMKLQLNNQELRHCEAGAVSISLDGEVVCIALGRSLNLDMDHQVGVGCTVA